ncbi:MULTISPECIES: winged helix-turn-helix domain-containing protein [Rhodobacterales]|uniref:helix-turn-helix transcriptional regulator n=1 Tax=Roseobacter sp. N2S TaxID=2663844 RepID=UPI00285DC9A1|nr:MULTISPECIES: winged helix-turn-helix domain-containing protein [Rhodobacterales]MDR6264058.1 DNA-binding CsgD family transcriptional regulator [Roseobacter sp. N2S]
MSVSFALLIERLWQSDGPETTRDIILNLGFNGLVFQRWSLDYIENWEGKIEDGFLEHYYGAQLDQYCPIAKAIHSWSRSYTFTQARSQAGPETEQTKRVESVFQQFGMNDGAVLLTGPNHLRSSVILTSESPVQETFDQLGGILYFAADKLTRQLRPGHPLLTHVPRENPTLSDMQAKILQMQIDHPELSKNEMALALGLSPKTLHAHHKKIAKKNGVTTFAGAVIKKLKES